MSAVEEPVDVEAPKLDAVENDYKGSRRSKFRFKSKRKHRDDDDDDDGLRNKRHHSSKSHTTSEDDLRRRRRRHHHGHHRSKQHRAPPPTPPDDPSLYDDTYLPNSRSENYLSPDAAFRESLFDAMADDEGAAFWEGVYGQPIHTYSSTRPGPEGELERMSEEEYASHVRAKMWEKTHQHVIEERERREEQRRQKEKVRKATSYMANDRDAFEKELQGSLRRGEERKRKARWRTRWAEYLKGWEELKGDGVEPQKKIRDRIPWPTESGKMADLRVEEVERFFRHAQATASEKEEAPDLVAVLKMERVRWHPDKIQHRLGSKGVDVSIVKAVTAIFQVVDRMWAEEREKRS